MSQLIEPLSVNFWLHVLYIIAGILITFLGYKIFNRQTEQKKEQRYTANTERPGGNWSSIVLLFLGAFIIISSIYNYPKHNRDLLKPVNKQVGSLHKRDETIFEYVRENRQDIRTVLNNLNALNSTLNQTEQKIQNYRRNQTKIYTNFQKEIDSSKTQFQNLTQKFTNLTTIKDSLLLLKNLNAGVKSYLNEQDELISRSIRLLESLHSRINMLENTIISLHREEIERQGRAEQGRLDSLDKLMRQYEAELNSE